MTFQQALEIFYSINVDSGIFQKQEIFFQLQLLYLAVL